MEDLKKWSSSDVHMLEMIDEFLEDHRQDQYTQSQIVTIVKEDKFHKFKVQRFKEIYKYAKANHAEEQLKYKEEKK